MTALIDELLRELCSDGVEFCALGEITSFASSRTSAFGLDATNYVGVDNLLPNFAGRKDAEYLANSSGAIAFAPGDVLVGNIRPYLKKVWLADRVGGASPDVLTIAIQRDSRDRLIPRFLYYLIASDSFIEYSMRNARGAKMPRGDKGATMKYRIPVPPLEVQREIVRILDQFTALEAELEAELEARRLQYAHYRDQLLTFRETGGIPRLPMGEFGTFIRGRRFTKSDMVDVGIPCIHYGEIYTHYGTSAHEARSRVRGEIADQLRYAQPGDVIVASVGETVDDVAKAVAWLGQSEVAIHDDSFAFRSHANPTYIAYVMQTADFHSQKDKYVARAKVKRVSGESLGKIEVPLPPRDEQDRIVAILDKFDALVNNLSIGLPAELAARRVQYAHYRDRLLTFEEAA